MNTCSKKFFYSVALFTIMFSFAGCGDDNKNSQTEKHIYDTARIVDVKSGMGNDVLGKASVLEIKSTDLTMENLEDWYFNYVKPLAEKEKEFKSAIIVYTDQKNVGVHCSSSGIITKDVGIEKDTNADTWSMTGIGGKNGEAFIEDSNNKGHLKKM